MTMTAFNSDSKIAVTAVTGFLGSGKTRYINQLLQHPGMAHAVVIVNEIGQLGIDQANWSFVQPSVILLEGGCLCCQMQGSMSATLQRLFTDALARRIPRFNHIIVETSGLADPSALRFTLHSDFFLKERFFYNGCVCIVDVINADKQQAYVEWSRQLVQADLVLLSRTDIATGEQARCLAENAALLTDAQIMTIPAFFANLAAIDMLMKLGTLPGRKKRAGFSGAPTARFWSGDDDDSDGLAENTGQQRQSRASALRPVLAHSAVRIITLELARPLRRSVFNQALEQILARLGTTLIRAKALLRFVNDPQLYLFNIVHAQRYPARQLGQGQDADQTGIVFFVAGDTPEIQLPRAEQFYQE